MSGISRRGIPAVVLFFVAPFVAEYLLGDLPLKLLPVMIVLAPMYGGGAVLIREFARWRHGGWPAILLLGAAYAVLEEGFITQSLFNPDYLHLHGHFLAPAHIAWLGTGGWWLLFMFNVHVFWSIGVSVALVEGIYSRVAAEPWLGRLGLSVVGAVFVLGCVANSFIGYRQNAFTATPLQFAAAGVAMICFVAAAVMVKGPARVPSDLRTVSPWVSGALAFFSGAAVQLFPRTWGWGAAGMMATVDLLFLALVYALSYRSAWSVPQVSGLGAGGALAYGLHAFLQPPITGGTLAAALPSHLVFLAMAVGLIAAGSRSRVAGGASVDSSIA